MNGITPILFALAVGSQTAPVIATNPSQQVKAVAVSIETSESNGSGVIIQRQPGKYLVLTAAHVVRDTQESHIIRASDGQKYRLEKTILFPQGIDLAVVSFSSNKNYPVATIGNSSDAEEGTTVSVAGYPHLDRQVPIYNLRTGRIVANSSLGLADGYGLVYSSNTLPGMSGGGVFNERGELIAIHGKGDVTTEVQSGNSKSTTRVKTGYDLGIPINTFIKLAKEINGVPQLAQKTAKNPNRPRSGDALLAGINEMRNKKYAQAISQFDRAIQIDPQEATAYYYRGLCKQNLQDLPAALADLNQAIQLNGNNAFFYMFRGGLFANLKDVAKMEADLNKAVQIDPNNSYAHTFHALLYLDPSKKQTAKAFADLNKAIALDSNNGMAYSLRGLLYYFLKDRANFLADLERSVAAYRANGEIENYNSAKNTLELLKRYGG
jgi:Flp pilus assembly protein TadD/V8-like Glu-specific endopeptidase